jgi:hypothetical protein
VPLHSHLICLSSLLTAHCSLLTAHCSRAASSFLFLSALSIQC